MAGFSKREERMFEQDFMGIVRVCRKVNAGVWRSESVLKYNLELLQQHATNFSKKYRTVNLRVETMRYYELRLVVTLAKEKSLYSVFRVANRVAGPVESVSLMGSEGEERVDAAEFEKECRELKKQPDGRMVSLNVAIREKGTRSIYLQWNAQVDIVLNNVRFSPNDIEYRLCREYALTGGYEDVVLEDIEKRFIGAVRTERSFRGYAGGKGTSGGY